MVLPLELQPEHTLSDWYKDPETGMPKYIFFSPYSKTMESLIVRNYKLQKSEVDIVTDGQSGQCAVDMIPRLKQRLKERKSHPFDLVLICAGTNDIALVPDTNRIINGLIEIHEICHQFGSQTVVITIPECERQTDKAIGIRNQINEKLKEYAVQNKDVTMMFDLHEKMPFHSLKDEEREMYWDDGLHFTPNGYKYWGEMLVEFLSPWIQKHLQNVKIERN